ncbi:hypothetical protein L1987_00726 [Smallanthus sonchifolius]|uniref:Uncharacterized protein n=1 Tax=Smallanthus sonchifolius TaxID=185202 RepID=A0ACB9K333_9ASTR|nr:hypothetical protein L1987_00726 [Smallanthus sonchifolius]
MCSPFPFFVHPETQIRVSICTLCSFSNKKTTVRLWVDDGAIAVLIDGGDSGGGGAHGVTGLDGCCNGCGHFSDSIPVPLFRQNQRVLRFVLGFSSC